MITYRQTHNPLLLGVYLNDKRVGTIATMVGEGFQYYTKNSKVGGEIYPTLEQCKWSLEMDNSIDELVENVVNDITEEDITEMAIANSKTATHLRFEKLLRLEKALDKVGEYAKCMSEAKPILEWFITYLTVDTTDDEHKDEMVNKAKEILTKLKGLK